MHTPATPSQPGPLEAGHTPARVLLVEEAPASRQFLEQLLRSDPQLRVTAAVDNGDAALRHLAQHRADVMLMDIDSHGDAGLDGMRRIMQLHPLPIVACTFQPGEHDAKQRSLLAGAVACVDKPDQGDATTQAVRAAHMCLTLKLMSEVKVVRRRVQGQPHRIGPNPAPADSGFTATAPGGGIRVIGIGASTGGPPLLQTILAGLPRTLPVPVLIVQHISAGFLPGMAQWLGRASGLPVHVGAHGVEPRPGHVYLAPDGQQMGMGSMGRIVTNSGIGPDGLRPSVAFLFRTLADIYGAQAVGVLLSGMGKDGAEDMKRMRERGAITIAQDSATSVVHGMPGEAIAIGGATHVLPAHKISGALLTLLQPAGAEGG